MTDATTYNLLDEPWIMALGVGGADRAVSLREAFKEAGKLRRLAGELPTQDAAVLRLMLAILHRALPVEGDEEVRGELWGQWWADGSVPLGQVLDYLDVWSDRFDLLDEDAPFFQVADLHTARGGTSGLRKIIADLPAGHQFFTNRTGEGATWLPMDEAARWLVHCQAFDVSGIKSGAVGDDRVKGGRGYPIGTGWSGNLGLVVLEGANLAQTLMLNLALSRDSPDDDAPGWEREPMTATATGAESARGPAQAMTWQSRRIRLVRQDDHVTDVLICNGDPMRVRNQHQVETMTAWRRSPAQQKKHGEAVVYMPQEHRADRAVWQGLSALLQADPIISGAQAGSAQLQAATLGWTGQMRQLEQLPADAVIVVRTTGLVYGSQNSVIETSLSDRVALRAEVLRDEDLQARAVRAAGTADTATRLLSRLAQDIASAEGRRDSEDGAVAREDVLQLLDGIFRRWVLSLGERDREEHDAVWQNGVRRECLRLAQELYAAASPAALRGREVTRQRGKTIHLDAGLAHLFFTRALDQDIPAAGRPAAATDGKETA
ncbi:MAG: type I-E CRISPR-associated protein Cse1/CasA [Ornithinimicrobium sp.]